MLAVTLTPLTSATVTVPTLAPPASNDREQLSLMVGTAVGCWSHGAAEVFSPRLGPALPGRLFLAKAISATLPRYSGADEMGGGSVLHTHYLQYTVMRPTRPRNVCSDESY